MCYLLQNVTIYHYVSCPRVVCSIYCKLSLCLQLSQCIIWRRNRRPNDVRTQLYCLIPDVNTSGHRTIPCHWTSAKFTAKCNSENLSSALTKSQIYSSLLKSQLFFLVCNDKRKCYFFFLITKDHY